MVFSRVHTGLRSYNGSGRGRSRGCANEAPVHRSSYRGTHLFNSYCVPLHLMMYLGMRKQTKNEISQVNALINAKLESKIPKDDCLANCSTDLFVSPSDWNYTLGNCLPSFCNKFSSLSRLIDALVQLNSLVSPILYSYRDRKIRKAVLELLGMRKPHASQPEAFCPAICFPAICENERIV